MSLSDLHRKTRPRVSVAYLSRIELGTALPRPDKLRAIGEALDADLDQLMLRREEEELVRSGLDPAVAHLAVTMRDTPRLGEALHLLSRALSARIEEDRQRLLRNAETAVLTLLTEMGLVKRNQRRRS
jgi:transcriptional regulator with XRE-family HTH domain